MRSTILPAILWVISATALIEAALVDLRHRIVPNRLVLIIAVCGLGLRIWSASGSVWLAPLLALLAAVSIVGLLGLLARWEWIGGGDAKLIGAVSLLFPTSDVGALVLSIAIAGGLLGLIYLAIRMAITRKPRSYEADVREHSPATAETEDSTRGISIGGSGQVLAHERMRIAAGEPMPYALAILGGVAFRFVCEAILCLSATSCSL